MIAWTLLGTLLGALGGAWLGVVAAHKLGVEPLIRQRDHYKKYMGEWEALSSQQATRYEESSRNMLAHWGDCLTQLTRVTIRFERADTERRALRSRLAAALWSNRSLKRENGDLYAQLNKEWRAAVESDACQCRKLDDQTMWRISNIEAQLKAQEGEL